MKHNGKLKGAMKRVKRKQAKKKLNMLNWTNVNNNTQFRTIKNSTKKFQNNPKDSKPDSGSDRNDISNHLVYNNNESSNASCDNIKESDLPTAITKTDKIGEFIRKSLNNFHPFKGKTNMTCPFILSLHSEGTMKVSEQEFKNMIYEKTAEIITSKSNFASQMIHAELYDKQQYFWIEKFKTLLDRVNATNSILETLDRKYNPTIKHVRNVGTNMST